MYTYLLTSAASKKNLAFDHRPELLNYLRQGLPDCNIYVYPKMYNYKLDTSNVMFAIIQARLNALQFLCLVIEETRARSILRPPFLNGRTKIEPNLHWNTLAQKYDISLDLLIKEQNLLEDYYDDVTAKSIIFFHFFCKQIIHAQSLKEIKEIETQIRRHERISTINS